jgi:multimeric flavodoxin WrbA
VAGLARDAAPDSDLLFLRDYLVRPCNACGYCRIHAGQCALNAGLDADDTRLIFERIIAAHCLCVVSPVYFYGLPAHMKALVDRAQCYFEVIHTHRRPIASSRAAFAIFTAGRDRGARLFEGGLRSLRGFFQMLGFSMQERLGVRGLAEPGSLARNTKLLRQVEKFTQRMADATIHQGEQVDDQSEAVCGTGLKA